MSDTFFEEEDFATKFNGKLVVRMLALTKEYWVQVVLFMLLIGLISFVDSYFTYLSKRLIDEAIVPGDTAMLVQIGVIFASLAVFQAIAVFGMIYIAGILGERIHFSMRKHMFDHLHDLSLSYFDKTPVGWIMARVTSDSERIAELVTWGLIDISWAVFNIIIAVVFMLTINWKLALVVLLIIPFVVLVAIEFKKKILVEYRTVRKINSKITGSYNENINGVRVTKAFRREEENLWRFGHLTTDMYHASYRAAWLSALFLPAVQLISAFALGSIVFYGGLQTRVGAMTIGGIQAFISYVTFMLFPIQELARVYARMQQSIASAERAFSLIDAVPEIVDRPEARDIDTLRGEIVFEHVDFYYEEGKPVLSNFSLTVHEGETIALVGPTGGGKSTIVNLLARFYEPKRGAIRIRGRDSREYALHALQSSIGMVLQTPHLFSGTVSENIRYGRLDANQDEIRQAATLAGAHEFIMKLEHGYDEQVGEAGNLLSVGQKQLINLARAVLVDPDIFVMDEATSSVDTISEALIQKGMETLMQGRASFIIAHRLSTIKRADRIAVIENGAITEIGTHAELIHRRGHYYDLYTKQFRHELEQEYDPFSERVNERGTQSDLGNDTDASG